MFAPCLTCARIPTYHYFLQETKSQSVSGSFPPRQGQDSIYALEKVILFLSSVFYVGVNLRCQVLVFQQQDSLCGASELALATYFQVFILDLSFNSWVRKRKRRHINSIHFSQQFVFNLLKLPWGKLGGFLFKVQCREVQGSAESYNCCGKTSRAFQFL